MDDEENKIVHCHLLCLKDLRLMAMEKQTIREELKCILLNNNIIGLILS